MDPQLFDLLLSLPKKNLINLLWSALDEMQAYNGRTRTYCILESIGAECLDNANHSKWKLPSLHAAKKNTASMGL